MRIHVYHKKSDQQAISYIKQTISHAEQARTLNSLLATKRGTSRAVELGMTRQR